VDQREGDDQQWADDAEVIGLLADFGGVSADCRRRGVVERRHQEDQRGEDRDPAQGDCDLEQRYPRRAMR
jgi:hypothetical protein